MPCNLSPYTDFAKSLDASTDVANPSQLEVKVADPGGADRFLVFTGTAVIDTGFNQDDEIVRRGVVQVNLDFPITSVIRFVQSATTAGLGTVSNSNDADEDTLWGVDCVSTEPGPDPTNPTTLILTAAVAVQGGDTTLLRMAYQANVLVQDLEPELQSILVDNIGDVPPNFQPAALLTGGDPWRGRLILTGPAPASGLVVTVTSGNPSAAPMQTTPPVQTAKFTIAAFQSSVDFVAPNTEVFNSPSEKDATITASLGSISKTALVRLLAIPK